MLKHQNAIIRYLLYQAPELRDGDIFYGSSRIIPRSPEYGRSTDQPLSLWTNGKAKTGYSKWHLRQECSRDVTGHAIGAYIRACRLSKSAGCPAPDRTSDSRYRAASIVLIRAVDVSCVLSKSSFR